jgi:hypothetical protein
MDSGEDDDPAAGEAQMLLEHGHRLQAELRRLQRPFLPRVLGRLKTASDLSAEAAVSASLRSVALDCLALVGEQSENWRLRVGAASVAPLAACRDWALHELHAIGERHDAELEALLAKEAKANERTGAEEADVPLPSPVTGHQCSILVRGLDLCTDEAELPQYEQQLRELFASFGAVLAVKVRVRVKGDGVKKMSWSLVTFSTPVEANSAVAGAAELDHSALSSGDWLVKLVDNRCVATTRARVRSLPRGTSNPPAAFALTRAALP